MTAGGGMGLDSGDTPDITNDQSSARWTDIISFATPLDFFLTAVAITGCLSTGLFCPCNQPAPSNPLGSPTRTAIPPCRQSQSKANCHPIVS
jgi:hypothetical protein